MKILVIEDDEATAWLIRRCLEKADYSVAHAADGETGLNMASQGDWDLIISDIHLPRIDGWEICRTLRTQRNTVPILIMSTLDNRDGLVQARAAGADDFLSKPFDVQVFLARVDALLRRDPS